MAEKITKEEIRALRKARRDDKLADYAFNNPNQTEVPIVDTDESTTERDQFVATDSNPVTNTETEPVIEAADDLTNHLGAAATSHVTTFGTAAPRRGLFGSNSPEVATVEYAEPTVEATTGYEAPREDIQTVEKTLPTRARSQVDEKKLPPRVRGRVVQAVAPKSGENNIKSRMLSLPAGGGVVKPVIGDSGSDPNKWAPPSGNK